MQTANANGERVDRARLFDLARNQLRVVVESEKGGVRTLAIGRIVSVATSHLVLYGGGDRNAVLALRDVVSVEPLAPPRPTAPVESPEGKPPA